MIASRPTRQAPAPGRSLARGLAAAAVAAGLLITGPAARAADTYWQSGTASANAWNSAGNWSNGVPTSTTNALTTSSGATIILGDNAQAKTFFVEGPIGGESRLSSGTLTLSDQLWMNIASGSVASQAVVLRLYDGGESPVSVTATNATLGVAPGTQGAVVLDSRAGGHVTLALTDKLTIGYDGSGSYVYSYPYLSGGAGGTVSITAGTIQTSVTSNAGAEDFNYIGTYNTGHSVTATNLLLGVSGKQGRAENYGGTWTIGNTALGDQASSTDNALTIADGGTFTNSGAFTVGVNGSFNKVYVGIQDGFATDSKGTLRLTGPNDLAIGSGSTSVNNTVIVNYDSTLSVANGNVVVGVDGQNNNFYADHGSTVTSVGARIGVNAGSLYNTAEVTRDATWTMNGTVRVGDKGSSNSFFVTNGGTVTLTGSGNNFYVGYDKSASDNAAVVAGAGSVLSVKAPGADIVVSGNVTGTGPNATDNVLAVLDGGLVDANRTLVGDGGQIVGTAGTITGDVIVGSGGHIAPGIFNTGALTFTGAVSFSNGGAFDVTIGTGTATDFIDVGGLLTLGGSSTLALDAGSADPGTTYIIAHYGTLAGIFGSITGLPAGATIDYDYLGLHQIAVIVSAAAVPEIALASAGSAFALIACSLALLERRGLRRRKPPA